jgi:hypothetical protein
MEAKNNNKAHELSANNIIDFDEDLDDLGAPDLPQDDNIID